MEHQDVLKGADGNAQARREGDEIYRNVFEQSAIGLALVSLDGHWIKANETLCSMFGYAQEELLQLTVRDVTYSDDVDASLKRVRQLVSGEATSVRSEKQYRRKDGKIIWGFHNLTLVRDGEGAAAYFIAQIQDVTARKHAEEELTWKTAFLEAMVHSSPDAIVVLDQEGKSLLFNQKMEDLWSFPEGIAQQDRTPWVAEQMKDPAGFMAHTRRLFADPTLISREELELKDGRTIDEYSSPVVGTDGKFYGRIFTCRDVTPYKRAIARLNKLFDISPDLIFIAGHNGSPQESNPAAEEILGYTKEELLQGNLKTLVLPEELPWAENALRQVVASGHLHEFEARCRCRDGATKWVEFNAVAIPGEDLLYITGRDITERKMAEQRLQQIRQEHETILGGIGDGVHWIGEDGCIKFENPAAASMLGYAITEMLGQPAHAMMHHTRADGAPFPVEECPIYEALRDGQVRHVDDDVFWRKDGSSFAVEYTVVPTRATTGQFNGAVVTFVDITERLRLETQMQQARIAAETANEAKTQFLANMSHEIRTPLNGIVGMTDLMAGTQLSTEQKDFLETIHASSENLLTIVNDILDFSKIEFGKLELDYHAFSLLDLIDDVIGLLSFRIVKKNLEFLTNIQKDLPVDYLGDATRIRQVLVNLVSNAVKFTERGEISLEVFAAPTKEGDSTQTQRLLFRVRDTGVGIPSDRLNRLFKVFSQVDASTTRRYGGSGLGLAICRKLVEIMGGSIGVESEANVGSVFSFEIPLQLGHPEGVSREGSELAGHRVLIVDDLETNRRMLTLQLARWGMDWVDVSTGQEALDLLGRGERFDAALIDFQMPNTDGMMVARQITRLLGGRKPPLVLISSQTGDLSMEECTQAGFSAVLAKPLRQNLLRSTLQQAFRTAAAPVVQPAAPLLSEQMPLSILTVEDNATNQKVARQILKRIGYDTDLVNNGNEAVTALDRKRYDLVFMDIHMPEMDGLEATRAIRQKRYPHGQPLIVALTADVLPGEREKCIEAGMDEYIPKPVKIESLKGIIEKIKKAREERNAPA